jgi:predicted metal-dependent phosphoesterase TrpH
MLIDLHTHTTASDGALAPAALVALAGREGVGVLGVTDHDTVAGLDEATEAAAPLGVEVIPGLEISCYYGRQEVHLLGYFLDARHPALLARLSAWREERVGRLHQMVERLRRRGIHLDADRLAARGAGGSVGRPHVAVALVEAGHVASVEEAFDRFLADGKPAYVPRQRVPVADAMALVLEAGGLPVLAHPGAYRNDGMIPELVRDGLAGIEVFHREHNDTATARYRRLATRYNLASTGGSDFHGLPGAQTQRLGQPSLPQADLDALRARRRLS